MSGVTNEGFVIKRLPEIESEIEAAIKEAFPNITTVPQSVMGQIIGTLSQPLSEIWEVMDAVYNSNYPSSAQGFSLDNVAQLTGITRLPATSTVVNAILEGTEATVVPSGTLASVTGTGKIFEQKVDATITKINVLLSRVEVPEGVTPGEPKPSTLFRIVINGSNYDFTSDVTPTFQEVVNGLINKINTAALGITAYDENPLIRIEVDDNETSFSVDVNAELLLDEIWTPTEYEAQNTGPFVCNANQLVTIETPVSGLNQIDNLEDGVLGTDVETDSALRIRRRQSLTVTGAATIEAIKARILQEVESVNAVTMLENRSDVVDGNGLPPHSFEAIVSGGANQDIGDKIWLVKPAGIETNGDIPVDVIDSQGETQVMNFSRPIDKYAWVDVVITKNPEEDFPADGADQVKAAILAYGQQFEVGQDMIYQGFYSPIYQVDGIGSVVLQISLTASASGPPAYVSTNIAVSPTEVALFFDDINNRISVAVAP